MKVYWEPKNTSVDMGNAPRHARKTTTRDDGEARSGWYPRGAETQANEDLTAFECTRARGGETGGLKCCSGGVADGVEVA